MLTLSEKVRGVLATDTPIGYRWWSERLAEEPLDALDSFEQDLRDWGFVYGLAYGIARAEDVWEPNDSVAERALEAARDNYARHYGKTISDAQRERAAEAATA